jgi:ppGpp synthetase/RelA/SpoT-type nucleotidyltranferase
LKAKLEQREKGRKEGPYKTVKEIEADIVDRAGVRIALYFPGDREDVDGIINSSFDVKKTKSFPVHGKPDDSKHPNRFSGYHAKHYRVHLLGANLKDADQRYTAGLIEIQVASVLMHAWSEVNHDLVYKPFSGNLSENEYAMLDQLNGLVLSGEIALENLQKAYKARVSQPPDSDQPPKPFSNQFEVAAFLKKEVAERMPHGRPEPAMGRADILFELLRRANLNDPQKLRQIVDEALPPNPRRPIAQDIIDALLCTNPALSSTYEQVKSVVGDRNPYDIGPDYHSKTASAVATFIRVWSTLQDILAYLYFSDQSADPPKSSACLDELVQNAVEINLLDHIEASIIYSLHSFHGDLQVRDGHLEDPRMVSNLTERVISIIRSMRTRAPEDNSDLIKILDDRIETLNHIAKSAL